MRLPAIRHGLALAFGWLTLLLGIATSSAQANLPDRYKEQRALYEQAVDAFKRNRMSEYRDLAAQLTDYPLYPYLENRELTQSLADAEDAEVADFLERYPGSPLAERLERRWLRHLGRTRQWQRYENFYTDTDSAELRCYHLRATRGTTPREQWLEAAYALWLVGYSQPDACDPVFDVLYDSPRIDTAALWERIGLAMDNGKQSLAGFLARKLPAAERKWAELWRYAHRRPASALRDARLEADTGIARSIRVHAIKRLARSQPDSAYVHLEAMRERLSPEQFNTALAYVARYAGYRRTERAYAILSEVPDEFRTETHDNLQARIALQDKDWQRLADTIERFHDPASRFSEWPYWHAQAMLHLNQREPAIRKLHDLARERYFHGFLAADYLELPYRLNHQPIEYEISELEDLMQRHPGLARAGELMRLGHTWTARREWYHAVRDLPPRDKAMATALAHEWNWHDRAIWTAAKAQRWDDVEVRFPLAYRSQVEEMAAQFQLDPALIFGIIRQESAFMADAHSSAGALGLMQLMPATGTHTAKLLRLPKPTRSTLLQASANLRLGSGYLKRMLDRYSDHPALAIAAYNAGPHRVDRWLPDNGTESAAFWIDTIPFRETRGYVRGVLAFTTVYDKRLNQKATPLAQRMSDVSGELRRP